jgi:hypothetical protein
MILSKSVKQIHTLPIILFEPADRHSGGQIKPPQKSFPENCLPNLHEHDDKVPKAHFRNKASTKNVDHVGQ